MSAITGTCSESSAQTLFNQRIQELRQDKLEKPDPLDQLVEREELKSNPNASEAAISRQKATEAGKGQFIDFYV